MKDNLNSHGNSPIMNFNTRDVGHIGIVNIIQPKKAHKKPNVPSETKMSEPAKPFQSLYASPTEAPVTQLNRFYIPQRIRGDGTDVASQIQEPTRTFGNVRESFQAVVPPKQGEEFATQTENPEYFSETTQTESTMDERELKSKYKPREKTINEYMAVTGILDREEAIKQLKEIAVKGPNKNPGTNVNNWFIGYSGKVRTFEGQQAADTSKALAKTRLEPQPKLERLTEQAKKIYDIEEEETPEQYVYATSK